MHNLIFNKLIALVLIGAGVFAVWMEADATFLMLALLIGVPMFFAKENWTTIEVREVKNDEVDNTVNEQKNREKRLIPDEMVKG